MPYFTTGDGTRLHYTMTGKGGPALLFVHGWCSNLSHWDAQARAFSRRHRVLRLDLRGHGRSDAPAGGPYTMRGFADDVAALARSQRVRGAVVVGHSMGCAVGLELARRHPKLVKALAFVDSAANPTSKGATKAELAANPFVQSVGGADHPAAVEQVYSRFFAGAKDRRLAARVVADGGATPAHVARGAIEGLTRFNAAAAAKRVKQPVLWVVASTSQVTSKSVREGLPQAQFAQVVGAGHFLQLEAPDQFNPMLRAFIEGL